MQSTMRAVVQRRYGPPEVLALEDVPVPRIGPDDVLVRVRAAGVCYPDGVILTGVPYMVRLVSGLRVPSHGVRGMEVAGTVEAIGGAVAGLRVGDEVFGWSGDADRHAGGCGGFAELARCRPSLIAPKPAALSFEQAAALPTSGVTALQAVRDWARVRPGQRVLVNGASGGVGSFAVQVARSFGARVTGVCSGPNVELVRSLGADEVIDYTREDATAGGRRYDAILDFPHYAARSLSHLRRALAPGGVLVCAANTPNRLVGGMGRVARARVLDRLVRERLRAPDLVTDRADLAALAHMVEAGDVTPVLGRAYALEETPVALGHMLAGHTRGRLVITV